MGNLKEKFYMHKIMKSNLLISQYCKVFNKSEAPAVKTLAFFVISDETPLFFCTKHGHDLKLQK